MSEKKISLDFGDKYQQSIIGHMIEDYTFFLSCIDQLEPEWLLNPLDTRIFSIMQEFHKKHGRKLNSAHEVKEWLADQYRAVGEKQKYWTRLDMCVISSKDVGLDTLRTKMTGWIRLSKFRLAINKASELHDSHEHVQAIDWIAGEIKTIQKSGFELDEAVIFNDPLHFLVEREILNDDCVTSGHALLDNALLDGSASLDKMNTYDITESCKTYDYTGNQSGLSETTTGGLMKGDTTMILGPSNSGKTTTVISMITANVLLGKKVLYITHEMKWEDIKLKIYQCVLRQTATELTRKGKDTTEEDHIKTMGNFIHHYLTYYSWLKAGDMYVESVINHITMMQEREISTSEDGKGYDLLVVDYPGKLQSKRFGQKHATWEQLDYIYDQFVNLALEHRFHAILPVQTNRGGYKVNQGDSSRLVDQGDVGGSFGLMQRASNVITLNRSPSDVNDEMMLFNIAKSRSSATHRAFYTNTEFGKSCSIGSHLRAGIMAIDDDKPVARDFYKKALGKI